MRATVIGAGVAGLACATELMQRGAAVTLVERQPGLGPGSCSWWAGGMLAPWCEGERAEEAVVTLGEKAAAWWSRHAGGVTRHGTLVLAAKRDAGELKRFARRTRNHRTLDSAAIDEMEPALAGRFGQALWFEDEAHLDPRAALASLLERLRAGGADLRFSTDAADAPRGDVTVDCRGLAAGGGVSDLRGVRGEMLVLECREVSLTRSLRLLHPRIPIYIVPRGDHRYMVGATMIESAARSAISARSLMELLGAAYALHPAFGEAAVVETGADARPAFPDNLPRVWREGKRVFVNGLYRHGFLLAPAMAQRAAELALETHTTAGGSNGDCLERQVL